MGHYVDAFRSYATFSGRAGRRAYWSFALFNFLFSAAAIVLDNLLGITIGGLAYGPLLMVYGLVSFLPGLSLCVRRLHDIGKGGLFILVGLIPLAGPIILFAATCIKRVDSAPDRDAEGDERAMPSGASFLEDPSWRRTHSLVMIAAAAIAFAQIIFIVSRLGAMGFGNDILSPFFSARNLGNLSQTFLPLALISLGASWAFARGGFDLSMGGVMAIAAMVGASLIGSGPVVAAAGALLAALAIGLLNALLVGVAKAPGALATAATAIVARYAAYALSGGQSVPTGADPIPWIGAASWIVLAAASAGAFLLSRSPGAKVAADAHKSAPGSGLRRAWTLGSPYLASALLAGLAGLFYMNRLRVGTANLGGGFEIEALFAILVSATVYGSGRVNVPGVLVGALLVSSLKNLMSLANFPSPAMMITIGAGIAIWFAVDRAVAAMMEGVYVQSKRANRG